MALVVVALSSGCADSALPDESDWQQGREPSGWLPLAVARDVCADCIAFEEVAVLGEDDGPSILTESRWLAVDGSGNYWVGLAGGPKVFTEDGEFLQQVGGVGQGPGEFLTSGPIYTDDRGRVHVFDNRNLRKSVFSGFDLVDEVVLPTFIVEAANVPETDLALVNAQVRTAERFGEPVHLLARDELTTSFGLLESGAVHLVSRRRVVAGPPGVAIVGAHAEYRIDAWTLGGERILGLVRQGLWEPAAPELQGIALGPDNPPTGRLIGLRFDGEGRLWVLAWVAKDSWQEGVKEVVAPNGARTFQPTNSSNGVYDWVIEVIDLDERAVIARSQGAFPGAALPAGFAGDGELIFGNRFTELGGPRVVVWRATLTL